MEFTGERFVPGIDGDIGLEHVHRYLVACRLVPGKRVLDIASGEGYGSNMMSEIAASVVGVDIDEASVMHARQTYPRSNVSFLVGRATDIPIADATVDVVVSFETIEHLTDHHRMMLEIKRVLVPGGVLVLSSPDRYEFSDVPHYDNPFHLHELYLPELKALLAEHFSAHAIYGQRVHYASVIAPSSGKASTFISHRTSSDNGVVECLGLPNPLYFVAVASDGPLPQLPAGIFVPQHPPYMEQMEFLRKDAEMHHRQTAEARQLLEAVRQQLDAAVADAEMHHRRSLDAAQQTEVLRRDIDTHQRLVTEAAQREDSMRADADQLRQQLDVLRAEVESQRQRTETAVRIVEALKASISWRATAPFRAVAGVGRWAYRLLQFSLRQN